MDECQTWTLAGQIAGVNPETNKEVPRYQGGCSTHGVTFHGDQLSQVNAALEAHVAENSSD